MGILPRQCGHGQDHVEVGGSAKREKKKKEKLTKQLLQKVFVSCLVGWICVRGRWAECKLERPPLSPLGHQVSPEAASQARQSSCVILAWRPPLKSARWRFGWLSDLLGGNGWKLGVLFRPCNVKHPSRMLVSDKDRHGQHSFKASFLLINHSELAIHWHFRIFRGIVGRIRAIDGYSVCHMPCPIALSDSSLPPHPKRQAKAICWVIPHHHVREAALLIGGIVWDSIRCIPPL
jgi:hypothetical protein